MAIDHHPKTNDKESSDTIKSLQAPITDKADEKPKSKHIGNIILNESNVVAIIGPFFQKVEGRTEKSLRNHH